MPVLKKQTDPRYPVFHDLMLNKIHRVLLLSTPYDAWIMEKDYPLAERIVNEYKGLNLSHPPRLFWVSSVTEALSELQRIPYDLVIVMPPAADISALNLGKELKDKHPSIPVTQLIHRQLRDHITLLQDADDYGFDRTLVWRGNPDILVTLIKSIEDELNVEHDTGVAGIRVILFVEDSPIYLSSLLPIFYRELVLQTQANIEQGLNEEHRLLTMRARPKILLANSHEQAIALYEKFRPYILGVVSDVSLPRNSHTDPNAGVDLLRSIKEDGFDIPLLMVSKESKNRLRAAEIPALFADKNSPNLHNEVTGFFQDQLGFGPFVFKTPEGEEVTRAENLRDLEKALTVISDELFVYHGTRNDFSRWLFARAEIHLASHVRSLPVADSEAIRSQRLHLANLIRASRKRRQEGIIVNFQADDYDLETEFFKIGKGSLGGKARGLAFFSTILKQSSDLFDKYHGVDFVVPQTLVITTDGFEHFVERNGLSLMADADTSDEEVAEAFLRAKVPEWVEDSLREYLTHVTYPLAVRSSSLLEDAQYSAYAGLYKTCMLPNCNLDIEIRVARLLRAVKQVYASTYFQSPKNYALRVGHRTEEERMAVMVQRLCGQLHKGYYYPSIAGVAQSYNFYPFGKMKAEDGVVSIALGLGKTVMDGGNTVRFSPTSPELAIQVESLDGFLRNSQNMFFSLPVPDSCGEMGSQEIDTLVHRDVSSAVGEFPVEYLTSAYLPDEDRLSDGMVVGGYPVVTFANVLKHNRVPLGEIVSDLLRIGSEGMGCPVEIEFSLDIFPDPEKRTRFDILQIRPMSARSEMRTVSISEEEYAKSFLTSGTALGNCDNHSMRDVIYVVPNAFSPESTVKIASEIGEMNRRLTQEGLPYLLIGPGRWGSADRWLGIPVKWRDISGVEAIVETEFADLKVEPSQGSHFFHNITALGIPYITVRHDGMSRIDWDFLEEAEVVHESKFVRHVRLSSNMTLKVDGRTGGCVASRE
jgi:hypothetical protein